jgi:hypothetical protein
VFSPSGPEWQPPQCRPPRNCCDAGKKPDAGPAIARQDWEVLPSRSGGRYAAPSHGTKTARRRSLVTAGGSALSGKFEGREGMRP